MPRFLVDEDVPRSTARVLRANGYDALDVRDAGLRGCTDREVFERAQDEGRVLVTCDLGFSNLLRFPLSAHAGIVVIRIPDQVSVATLNLQLLRALSTLGEEPLDRTLVIVEMGHIRVRRDSQIP
jgi:predicted nuclease of predicted toxin-antitoxin system